MRRQISLSNPLTVPVSFRVETSGPFVINPYPPKKRLNSGKTSFETQVTGGGGGGDDARCRGRRRQQSQLAGNNSQATRSGDGASCANRGQRSASVMDTQDHNQHQQHHPQRQHRRSKDLISLLPGQNRQLEVVFLPSRASAEMSECLKSSFSPGTEDIPRLVLRTTGELTIAFCTGHVQRIFLRGEVLRPMITVAPATHSFGTIHTERSGNATLFLGNPTFADADWSLVHIPIPPPKKRLIHSNNAAKATAAGTTPTNNPARAASGAYAGRHTGKPGGTDGSGSHGRSPAAGLFNPLVVDDPSVFVFGEEGGVLTGVKLPLKSSAACLPEDWNRLENACWPQQRSRVTWGGVTDCCSVHYPAQGPGLRPCQKHPYGPPPQGSIHSRRQERPETLSPAGTGARPAMPAAVVWRDEPHGQRQVVGPTLKLETFLTRKEETTEGYRAPRPLEVVFVPKHNVLYRSRFRLTVKGGESAEVVLEGCGTYREDFRPGRLPRV
ncbi:unnamed protein product [Ectocarpus sp. 12 AP-2014]